MAPQATKTDPGTPGTLYTTETVPAPRRRAYWREALSRTFGAVDMGVPDEVERGTLRTSPLGQVQAVVVDGDPMRAVRTRRLAAGSDDDYVVVKLLSRGAARIEQDGREACLRPGQLFVYDMSRPVRLTLPERFLTKSLVLPRRVLGLSEADLQRITASPLGADSALGGLLTPLLSRLVDTAETYPQRTGELVARTVVDLVQTLAEERLGRAGGDTADAARLSLVRIRAYIDRHLAHPELTPQSIARAHHISVRYLHKLFELEDITVSRWIQQRRLERCRDDLARREVAHLTIAAVAHRWGFTSASHFSRVFRAAYGVSPAEWRGSARRRAA
ncbi:AraC family transcriptional regulator [Streptomyces capoamus]|uniref:AraC family transcriptional regulator n=1 Tax=Streptomyces capoamus TaxID=68183 RepID=A0A919C2X2_9ACTN|nr:helix-turn-helix domain-containing protein [Streptomyces capoamus]GGW14098.1 AraC family transcriptional regulator [Streptomyces libani subsp. rufus]GHG39986.1 AraC family transcriptional regulator [Streptomyces capoamus]